MIRMLWVPVSLLLVVSPVFGYLINYKHYDDSKSWQEARDHCTSKHTDLVIIRNQQENDFFKQSRGWIGLYRDMKTDPWKWSRGPRRADFKMLGEGELSDSEHCAYIDTDHIWKSDGCGLPHTYICYDERLVLVTENKTWEEALHHCRSLGGVDPGDPMAVYQNHLYDLATLSIDGSDLSYAKETVKDANTEEVWTGLRFLAGQWVWVDKQYMPYDILPCPNNRSCGVLEKNSNIPFGIRDCNERRNFLCYKRP
ncbi:secretory phospholipase A2 receptor-like isoform X2 [Parambassis ranga]|nr:secretory phospholipase A2 receptor-like isoform X2 [Parambassis ranga]